MASLMGEQQQAAAEALAASKLKAGVTPAQDNCTPQDREPSLTPGVQLQTANPLSTSTGELAC